MACKWTDLFSVGEEFDDEDLLQADWTVPCASASAPALQSADLQGTSNSNTLKQAISVTSITNQNNKSDAGRHATHNVPGQTSVLGLRGLCASKLPSTSYAEPTTSPSDNKNSIQPSGPTNQNSFTPALGARGLDDFDDWDVDLADLDGYASRMVPVSHDGQPSSVTNLAPLVPHVGQLASVTNLAPPTSNTKGLFEDSISPAKRMRPSACATSLSPPDPSLRSFTITTHTAESLPIPLQRAPTPKRCFLTPEPSLGPFRSPAVLPALPHSPVIPRMANSFSLSTSLPSPVTPRLGRPQPQGLTSNAMRQPAGHVTAGLFQAVSPCPQPTPSPRSLHTPVLTNHLVQLVSASKKTPQRPRTDPARPKTRRFPGPAGMLPQQLSGKNLDDIVVSVPQTPAHGAVARLRSEVSSSAGSDEEDFSGGAWAAMKAEMGLDEKNPSCFLHSYSVVMVLRKAALKQLNKNKVPNMAVELKSILHTHADAKAVFKDPTGEMQGTVHRRLLEDRQGELKTGAVLLLKQVGVFSPSHRNHYLNVTPNNLLRIYPPDGSLQPCTALSQHALGPLELWHDDSARAVRGPVSQMELRFEEDEEDEEELGQKNSRVQGDPEAAVNYNTAPSLANEPAWDTDDLDELLGEMPVETYSV